MLIVKKGNRKIEPASNQCRANIPFKGKFKNWVSYKNTRHRNHDAKGSIPKNKTPAEPN